MILCRNNLLFDRFNVGPTHLRLYRIYQSEYFTFMPNKQLNPCFASVVNFHLLGETSDSRSILGWTVVPSSINTARRSKRWLNRHTPVIDTMKLLGSTRNINKHWGWAWLISAYNLLKGVNAFCRYQRILIIWPTPETFSYSKNDELRDVATFLVFTIEVSEVYAILMGLHQCFISEARHVDSNM